MALNERDLLKLKKLLREVNDLRAQFGEGELSIKFDQASAETFKILNQEAEKFKSILQEADDVAGDLLRTTQANLQELGKTASAQSKYVSGLRKTASLSEQLYNDAKGIDELQGKQVKNLAKQAKLELTKRAALIKELELTAATNEEHAELLSRMKDEFNVQNELVKKTEARLKKEKQIQKTMGLSGAAIQGIVGGLGKLGIQGDFFEGIEEDMRETAKSGSKFKTALTGAKGLARGIGEALSDPLVIFGLIVKAAKFLLSIVSDLQKRTATIAQNFSLGEEEARKMYDQVNAVGDATGDIFYFNEELIAAQHEINKAVGLNLKFNEENAKTFQDLTQYMGMSAENAGMLFRMSAQMGKGFKETALEVTEIVNGLNEGSTQIINQNDVFDQMGKASANVRFNIQGGFEGMVKSAHTAARLAMSMNEIASAARSALNFEDSIASEMNAELFLQKDLNLERFRAAALTGDTATQAAELERLIKDNMGGLEGNVLAQEAFANALGISNEQLSESMLKIKEGKSLQEEQQDAAQGNTDEIAKMGKNAVRFERTLQAAVRAFKSSLLPLAKALEPLFISVANSIAKMGTFFSTKVGKTVAAIAGIAAGGVILFKAGKGLLNMFTGGMFKRGNSAMMPLYTYNVNESSGGGGDMMDFAARALTGRKAGWGGGFKGFLGKGGYAKDLLKKGKPGMVSRARTFRALKDIFTGGSGTFVGGTGPGSKVAAQAANLTKSTTALSKASTLLTKAAGPLALLDFAVGGYTGYSQSQMSAQEQRAAGVKEGIGGVEASIQGVLTGGAEKGSMFTSLLGGEKGSAGDELLGLGTSAARGAGLGATIGTFIFPGIGTALGAGVGAVVGTVAEGFKIFTDPNSSLRKGLSEGISYMGEKLSEGWEATKKFGSEIFDSLKGAASSAWEGVKSISSSVGDAISSGWDSFTGWLGFANGGIAPGGFRAFANGGMVTSPTIGLVGEGGMNEAIVPLPDGKSIPVQMAGGGGGSSQEVASLLRELVTLVKQGGDIYLDGNKVGKSLALATSKMG